MANPEYLAKLKEGVDAWNDWRRQAPDIVPDLSGAELKRANLSGANLSGANLNGVDLREADLGNGDLSVANMKEACLVSANLSGADLDNVDLRAADLSGADLTAAILERADLSGANLAGTDVVWADFCRATVSRTELSGARTHATRWTALSLSEARGLDSLEHAGPSTVGADTLRLSKGRIPDAFLRGCGLSDWEIEFAKLYDPDLQPDQIEAIQYRVFELRSRGVIQISPTFISYAHSDSAFVDALGERLDTVGVRYWRDIRDATAGRLDKVVERGISLNPTVLLVLSARSVASDWVEFEVDHAMKLSKQLGRDVLCPIALDKGWLESDRFSGNLRVQIKKYSVLDFSRWQDEGAFDAQFRKLVDGLGLHYRGEDAPKPL